MGTTLISNESGFAEDLPPEQAEQALSQGTHGIPMIDKEGNHVVAPLEYARDYIQQGYTQPDDSQREMLLNSAKYNSTPEQVKTALEGAAEGALPFGISTAIEKGLGVPEENIRARREYNPGVHELGKLGGFAGSTLIPGIGQAKLLGKAGEAVAAATGLGAEGASLLSRLGAKSVGQAVEMIGLQTGDEVTKMMIHDPNQSVETSTIASNILEAGLLGAGFGAAFGAAGEAWKAGVSSKVGKFVDDFKDRINFHATNPEPVTGMVDELQNKYNSIKDVQVYGANGLKEQEIQKLMPEMSPKIMDHANETLTKVNNVIEKMEANPADYPDGLVSKLRKKASDFESKITESVDPVTLEKTSQITPGEIFSATNDLKQNLQEWGKFNKHLVPLAEKDFRNAAKELSHDLRTSLENPEVWGKAAERQQSINKAFSEYLPTLKNFESKFMSELNGEMVIDPGKVNTYMNQLGKPNAEIKQSMLDNFLKSSEKYEKAIGETHANLGLESPTFNAEMGLTKSTLDKLSPGARIADQVVKKGLANLGGEAIGATIGGTIGHQVGAGGMGALIGEHALGPFFSSILPSIMKPLLESANNPGALKNVVDYGVAVAKGETIFNRAAANLFHASKDVLPLSLIPSEKQRAKLSKVVDETDKTPNTLIHSGSDLAHYLPGHTTAVAETATRVTSYLSQLKPRQDKQSPLDSKLPPSSAETARYNNALNIAQQPLITLAKIKSGTLTKEDVTDMQSMYPTLYATAQSKIVKELMGQKPDSIPYKTRLSMSMFLGSPLDSTMTQGSIASAQPKMPQGQPMPMMPQTGGKHSMKSLSKMAALEKTPSQSREMSQAMKSQ